MAPSTAFQTAVQSLLRIAPSARVCPASRTEFRGPRRSQIQCTVWSDESFLHPPLSCSPLSTTLGNNDILVPRCAVMSDATLRHAPAMTEQRYRDRAGPPRSLRKGHDHGCCDVPLPSDGCFAAGLVEPPGSGVSVYWEQQGGIGPVASLERSYVTDAAIGRVECNSKGCRPVYDKDDEAEMSSSHWFSSEFSGGPTSSVGPSASVNFASRYSQSYSAVHPVDSLRADREHLDHQRCWYEAAVAQGPFDTALLTQYAKFAWNELRDAKKAEALFKQAIEGSPSSSEALASYALFLWGQEAMV